MKIIRTPLAAFFACFALVAVLLASFAHKAYSQVNAIDFARGSTCGSAAIQAAIDSQIVTRT